jgi:hypothetical protein
LEIVLGDRVEPCIAREAAVTFVGFSELAVSDVEEEVRVEEFAVPAQLTSAKNYDTLGTCREATIGSDLWVNAPNGARQ